MLLSQLSQLQLYYEINRLQYLIDSDHYICQLMICHGLGLLTIVCAIEQQKVIKHFQCICSTLYWWIMCNYSYKLIFKMESNYKGLANIGATCYMNSLLQTLYMTPDFKQAIYLWQYNDRLHPKPADSILYQLQRLFAKLDMRFPGPVDTRDLVKSFQWEDEEAQMQQDIQQFNRVLFEALQISLTSRNKTHTNSQSHFVRDLYEGEMVHFTKCSECLYESQKEQSFQDLILSVKNPYERIYNNCVELGIQRYMKPEILDQDNLYLCSKCEKKVKAERGVRFLKMPKLLNIILRRFDFDYFTFQRIKVNDRVEFPHVLNFNNYMQGYENIQNKCNEDSSAYFLDRDIAEKKKPNFTTTNAKKVPTKKPLVTNIAGKKTTKPSANTKSFLQEMRKKKMQVHSVQDNEDLIFVSGTSVSEVSASNTPTMPVSVPKLSEKVSETSESAKRQSKIEETSKEVEAEKQQKATQRSETTSDKTDQTENSSTIPVPPPFDLPSPVLTTPFGEASQITMQEELEKKFKQMQRLEEQKLQKMLQLIAANKEKAKEYLKEGPLVYELYAVLVHSGSAGHGHYYSYIKSIQNGHWFCFNDERVTEINVQEIERSFGGGASHANAYALYYRQVDEFEDKREISIPKYIEAAIEEQAFNAKQRERLKMENLENIIVLKIHYQLLVKQLEAHKNTTLATCLQQAREMFDIKEESIPLHNSRLRMFNPVSDVKLETYEKREGETLDELKISSYRSMILETKKEDEVFEEFIAGQMKIRIVLWEQSEGKVQSLDEAFLKVHKVSINRNSLMKDVEQAILKKRKQVLSSINKEASESICIVKRHQNDQYSYHEIINVGDYLEKTVNQLMVLENEILFVEPDSGKLMWPQQFEDEIYRITIKYHSSNNSSTQSYLTDSRKTIGALKEELCALCSMDIEETIMRRGTKSGLQLKDLNLTMKDSRFITGTQVFLDKGLPAKPGQVRIQLFLAYDADLETYNRLHEFEYIVDVPVNGQWKASQVKKVFMKIVKKYRDMDLNLEDFRIREKVSDKIGKIYRERPIKEQQLIEKREIAIELKPERIDSKDFKDFSIYVRIWDPEQWTLSQKYEFIVSKTTTMNQFASLIEKTDSSIAAEEMQACRILSIHKFNILDLCQMEYFQMSDVSVTAEPLFVNADGLLYIFKSNKKQPRLLTKQEEIKFGGKIKPNLIKIRSRQTPTSIPARKEKGVSIKVVEKMEEEEEELQ